MPRFFASRRNWCATSLTCETDPGADSIALEKTCLDRVDDDRARLQSLNLVDDVFEVRLGKDENVLCFDCEPLATQLDLPLRLFTGDIQHERSGGAESVRHLKQQRALANTGIAADQYERTRHDAAAEHAIEFSDAEEMRTSSCGSISVKGTAETSRSLKLLRLPVRRVGCDFSSTSEFHSPHSAHLPSHLPVECPQF
jgi:hypothetical protein